MRFRFGECVLDEESRQLWRDGESVHLTPKAFQLMAILLRERPRAVSKSELQERLWPTTFVSESNLPTLIREVRSAIDDSARGGRHLRTIHRFGYAFCGTAEELESDDASARSLAILPLENASGNPELAYVAIGISEGLINVISRMPAFRVTPRATAFRHAASTNDLPSLVKHLGVRSIVTGRVTGSTSEVTLQIDLLDAASAQQLWGGQFRRRVSEIAGLENEIAGEIVAVLSPRPVELEQPAHAGRETRNSEAYLLNMKGRFHWNRRTPESLQRAVQCFREAADLDRNFGPPRVGLAEAYVTIGTRDQLDPNEAFFLAEAFANSALEIDPHSAEAHAALAAVEEIHRWNWSGAEERYLQALALQPNNATALQWYALHLSRRGRHEEARQHMERAAGLDPLSLIIGTNRGLVSYLRRDFRVAMDIYDEVLELDPHYEGALLGKVLTLDLLDERPSAWQIYDRLIEAFPESAHLLAFSAHSLASGGQEERGRERMERVDAMRSTRFISGIYMAMPLLALG
ncbi:MAG: winged helix-turn-helix domain-containing protein, partial [Thermoanaerobaculia bacterium]